MPAFDGSKMAFEAIIKDASKGEIGTVWDFLQQYLFESDNGLSTIKLQLITHERREQIALKVNNDIKLLTSILTEIDINTTLDKIAALVVENTGTVKHRFLRALFPAECASPDAPNRLWQRLSTIKDKLDIDIPGGTVIEKHHHLMHAITGDDAKKQMFYWELQYMLENRITLKKAIVYYGAPGTGKTFRARKTAERFIDEQRIKVGNSSKSGYNVETVQFHPSYAYEDFMEGIRPASDGTHALRLQMGTFKQFCKTHGAKEIALYQDNDFIERFRDRQYNFSTIFLSELNDHQRLVIGVDTIGLGAKITLQEAIEPAFFIIDEINRAELSRVFGELMFCLEYRGLSGKIKTQYAYLNKSNPAGSFYMDGDEDWFFIPQNILVIGTMNNIDRSVDSFDFAMRRRFSWEEINPSYDIIREQLPQFGKDLAPALEVLNKAIQDDPLLGRDYRIGHAYVLKLKPIERTFDSKTEISTYLWFDAIKPLLEEYYRGLGDHAIVASRLAELASKFGLKDG